MTKVDKVVVEDPAPAQPAKPRAADGVLYVTDKTGRRIGLKKLKPSARFMLSEACDTKTASGEMQAIVAASVLSIDEEGFPPLKDKADLLRRLDQIGDDGLAAITGPVLEMYGVSLDQKDVDLAKNL